jgi:hypothetical protein
MQEPTLQEWLILSNADRRKWLDSLNPYGGEGYTLLAAITDRFREEFGNLRGLEIGKPGVYHGGYWVISASHPFVFDRRKLPNQYLDVTVHASVRNPLPPEFSMRYPEAYVWAPPNFAKFVDRCAGEIREQLGDPNMSLAEMLHALIGRPFEEHLSDCRQWVREGLIPSFE